MSNEDDHLVAQRVAEATEAALQAEGMMPTRLVVLAEVIGSDGAREFWTAVAPDHLKMWDSLGLLHMAIAREEASLVRMEEDD